MVSDPKCHLTPGFIAQFCAHTQTRYGLCQICGAIVTPGMLEHIEEFRAGDCPWCAHAEPDEVYQGSPVDWACKIHHESCQFIRMYSLNDDCKSYWPRKVDIPPGNCPDCGKRLEPNGMCLWCKEANNAPE